MGLLRGEGAALAALDRIIASGDSIYSCIAERGGRLLEDDQARVAGVRPTDWTIQEHGNPDELTYAVYYMNRLIKTIRE